MEMRTGNEWQRRACFKLIVEKVWHYILQYRYRFNLRDCRDSRHRSLCFVADAGKMIRVTRTAQANHRSEKPEGPLGERAPKAAK